MQNWSHMYLRRGCGAALITMAAVQAGVAWREPSPHSVALESLPPLQLIASAQDDHSVVPAQFAAVNPAARNHRAAEKSHRLPPGQSAAPRRLPPVSGAHVARRLPPVTPTTETTRQLAATDEQKSPNAAIPHPLREVGRTGAEAGDAPSNSLALAAPQLVEAKPRPVEMVGDAVRDIAKPESVPQVAQKSESSEDRIDEILEDQRATNLRHSGSQPGVTDVTRSGDRPQRTLTADRVPSVPALESKTETLDQDDPLRLIPNPLQPDWKKTGSALSIADRQADELVRNAATLARRGATYSSRRELESALVVLAQALDSHYETTGFTQCLHRGLLALEEADDFAPSRARGQLNLDIGLIVSRHRSGVVSANETTTCTAAEMARRYESFAQEHLAAACGNSPLAAHALFGMGKVYSKMSEDSAKGRQFGQRAMVLHQTALKVDGTHSPAATELGTLLARSGRLQEAREVLIQGLSGSKSPETWRQLADVHAQLGENLLANQARAEAERIVQFSRHANQNTVIAPNGTAVRWVDVATFQRVGQEVPPSNGMLSENRLQQPSSSPTAKSPSSDIPRTATQPRRLIRSW